MLIGISAIIIVGTQFLIPDPSHASQLYSPLLRILYIPGRTGIFQVFYPILPWLGIVLFGFVFGKWLLHNKYQAYQWSPILGSAFLIGFIASRLIGGFGNIHAPENSNIISFLNVTKYPPSLAFTLLTLGFCFIFMGLFSRLNAFLERRGKSLLVFGKSAFFFYILHLYLFAIAGLFFVSRGGSSLAVMYLIWLIVLFILYPLCLWYGRFKKKKPADSLWRFF
jgi:uncharacterized membrane protein